MQSANDEHKTGSRTRGLIRWVAGVLVATVLALAVTIPVVQEGIKKSEQRTAQQIDAKWKEFDADLTMRRSQEGYQLINRIAEQNSRSGDTIILRMQAENDRAIDEVTADNDRVVAEFDRSVAELSAAYSSHVDAICTNDYLNTSLRIALDLLIDYLDEGNVSLEEARTLINGVPIGGDYEKYSAVCGVTPDNTWIILGSDGPTE